MPKLISSIMPRNLSLNKGSQCFDQQYPVQTRGLAHNMPSGPRQAEASVLESLEFPTLIRQDVAEHILHHHNIELSRI